MTDLSRMYWRVPRWTRYLSFLILTGVVGVVVDTFSPGQNTVNIVFLAVVISFWGMVINADYRRVHGGGQPTR